MKWVCVEPAQCFARLAHAPVDARHAHAGKVKLERQLAAATRHVQHAAALVQMLHTVRVQEPLAHEECEETGVMSANETLPPALTQQHWHSSAPEDKSHATRNNTGVRPKPLSPHLAVRICAVGRDGRTHAAARDFICHPLRLHGEIDGRRRVEETAGRARAAAAGVEEVLANTGGGLWR